MDRFEITFTNNEFDFSVDLEETEVEEEDIVDLVDTEDSVSTVNNIEDVYNNNNLEIHFSNTTKNMVIDNQSLLGIKSIEMYNILGQSIYKFTEIPNEAYNEFKTKNLNPGSYIMKLETEIGTLAKKVLVQ